MPSLTAQQRQTAINSIIHMEGTDGSKDQYGPTIPGWGGGNSALSYGQFQNDISQGENKYDVMSNSQALLETLDERGETPQQPNAPRPGRRVASGRRDDPIFVYEVSTRVAH